MDDSIRENQDMEHNENSGKNWSDSVREALAAFSRQAGESSQQLAKAAERFATDAVHVIEAAAQKADEGARRSQDAATSAVTAAAEARQLVESMRGAVSDAVEQARSEARAALKDASDRAGEAVSASQLMMSGFEERVSAALQQVEQAAVSGRDYAAQAASAAQAARGAAESGRNQQSGPNAEATAESARTSAAEVASLRTAVTAAQDAAREARELAVEANTLARQAPAQAIGPVVSSGAEEVLVRLEADYSLLTRLVQELHARIAALSTQTAPVYQFSPPATAAPAEADTGYGEASEPSYAEPEVLHEPAVAWREPAPAYAGYSESEAAPAQAPTGRTISGRVLVSISPVPDFDRLLSLDGALGRMSGIGNVTLADYASEEVTFRVEVDPPTSVEDFRSRLSQSAGASIEVVASDDEGLALRLAS